MHERMQEVKQGYHNMFHVDANSDEALEMHGRPLLSRVCGGGHDDLLARVVFSEGELDGRVCFVHDPGLVAVRVVGDGGCA